MCADKCSLSQQAALGRGSLLHFFFISFWSMMLYQVYDAWAGITPHPVFILNLMSEHQNCHCYHRPNVTTAVDAFNVLLKVFIGDDWCRQGDVNRYEFVTYNGPYRHIKNILKVDKIYKSIWKKSLVIQIANTFRDRRNALMNAFPVLYPKTQKFEIKTNYSKSSSPPVSKTLALWSNL